MIKKQLEWLKSAFKIETESCIEWPFYRTPKGYGRVDVNGKPVRAHRLVCIWAHGEPKSDRNLAAHSCNNPSCINKKHLRWATPKENTEDRIEDGTYFFGIAHPRAKLTENQVRTIRTMAGRKSYRALAAEFQVSISAISLIVNRRNWKHI